MENKLIFRCEVFLNGEHCETQYYTETFSERVISIHQKSEFVSGESKLECNYTINPRGYIRVEVNSNENSLRIRLIDEDKLEVYHNGKFKEYIEIHREDTVLFDGPSPFFDYFNYMYFVAVENEIVTRSVFVPDVITGNLLKKKYSFLKQGNVIHIKKDGKEAEIETTNGYQMLAYKCGELSYVFGA
jgi:hypothetical protein